MSAESDKERLAKVHPNEEVFIIRAQDQTAPKVLAYWILENIETAPEAKLKEVFYKMLEMVRYDRRKPAD